MVKKYDWKITAKKFWWIAAEVIVAGLISYAADHPAWMVLVPCFEAVRNYIKHR